MAFLIQTNRLMTLSIVGDLPVFKLPFTKNYI